MTAPTDDSLNGINDLKIICLISFLCLSCLDFLNESSEIVPSPSLISKYRKNVSAQTNVLYSMSKIFLTNLI
jgi:hypothetical protein